MGTMQLKGKGILLRNLLILGLFSLEACLVCSISLFGSRGLQAGCPDSRDKDDSICKDADAGSCTEGGVRRVQV